ncbi:hypothetical protein [Ornithinibacillus halophilus]|uniref:Uncharacterized protein n=1 Tax=Ornithinibacillus halophilus TaxID=930117 RepID=A0A1M5KNQ3_9BACI|nr:hypothetical protein [Ornithinibacillus halophilus]SHG54391.1 hypothetical protein SAMN05216225_10407 [Ornithinibacillus halophilus]
MKRYSTLISFITVIILVIGTFYIQKSFASSSLPDIEIKKVRGIDEEVNNLTIHANLMNDGLYEQVEITNEETTFASDESFVERYLGSAQPEITELQKKYRNFMRGKIGGIEFFFEDDNYVAYADVVSDYGYSEIRNFDFSIDVLDKETEDNIKITEQVPNKENFSYIWVQDVQIHDDELMVTTVNDLRESNGTEVYVYTFSLKEKKLISDHTILNHTNDNPNSWVEMRLNNAAYGSEPLEWLLLSKEEMTHDSSGMINEQEKSLYVYNYETNGIKELDLPEGLSKQIGFIPLLMDSNTIYFPTHDNGKVGMTGIDILTQEITIDQTFDLNLSAEQLHNPYLKIMDGKIYMIAVDQGQMMTGTLKDVSLMIADLTTFEVLYEGKLEIEGDNNELYISNITVD